MSELKFARTGLAPVKKDNKEDISDAYIMVNFGKNKINATVKFYQKAITALDLKTKVRTIATMPGLDELEDSETKKELEEMKTITERQTVSFDFIEGAKVAVVYNSTNTAFSVREKFLTEKTNTVRLSKAECEKLFATLELPKEDTLFNLKEIEIEGVKAYQLEKGEIVVKERTEEQKKTDEENKALTTEFNAYIEANKIKIEKQYMIEFHNWKRIRNSIKK